MKAKIDYGEMNTNLDNDKGFVSKRKRRKTRHLRDSKANASKMVSSPFCEERRYSCLDAYTSTIRALRNFRGTLDLPAIGVDSLRFNYSLMIRVSR